MKDALLRLVDKRPWIAVLVVIFLAGGAGAGGGVFTREQVVEPASKADVERVEKLLAEIKESVIRLEEQGKANKEEIIRLRDKVDGRK